MSIKTVCVSIVLLVMLSCETTMAVASTARSVWDTFVTAMQEGNITKIQSLCTSEGFASLALENQEEEAARIASRLGKSWSTMPVHLPEVDQANHFDIELGPESKRHVFRFQRVGTGWKLARWWPGD